MNALSVTEKAPEQSGKPTRVLVACESRGQLSSYGDPVLEWRRPGGSGFGHNRPVVASRPKTCRQVAMAIANNKQSSMAHVIAQDAARQNADGRDPTQVGESASSPELTKASPATGQRDGRGSLGQVVGAQGVLVQPE
jgi:hypothetical protein